MKLLCTSLFALSVGFGALADQSVDIEATSLGHPVSSRFSLTNPIKLARQAVDQVSEDQLVKLTQKATLAVHGKIYDAVFQDKERYTYDSQTGRRMPIYYKDDYAISQLVLKATGVNFHSLFGPFSGLTRSVEGLLLNHYVKPLLTKGLNDTVRVLTRKLYNTGLIHSALRAALLPSGNMDALSNEAQSIAQSGNGTAFTGTPTVDLDEEAHTWSATFKKTFENVGQRIQKYLRRQMQTAFAAAMPDIVGDFAQSRTKKIAECVGVGVIGCISPTYMVYERTLGTTTGMSPVSMAARYVTGDVKRKVSSAVQQALMPMDETIENLEDGTWTLETVSFHPNDRDWLEKSLGSCIKNRHIKTLSKSLVSSMILGFLVWFVV